MPVDYIENDVNAGEVGDIDDQEVVKIKSVRKTIKGKKPGPSDERPVSTTSEDYHHKWERGTGGTTLNPFSVYASHNWKRGDFSVYSNKGGAASTFGKVAILKVVMFDLAVSLGDAVTDILQGVYLIIWHDEEGVWRLKTDTWHYGLWVLVVCWVPGLVCVIHILSHYRSYQLHSYQFQYEPNTCVPL